MPVNLPRRRFIAASLAAATLAACSSDPVPQAVFYRLGAPATPPARAGGPMMGTLEVPPLRAAGIVNGRSILYREGGAQLLQYSYHSWTEPPTAMLQRSLIDVLRAAQAFQQIVPPDMRLDRDFELRGDLKQWEHVRAAGAAGSVAIDIEFALRRVRDNQLLLLKSYRADTPATGEGIETVVAAFTRGMDTIYGQLLTDLAALKTPEGAR